MLAMKNILKVTGIALLSVFYACQSNSNDVNLERNTWNWSVNKSEEEQKIALMTDAFKIADYEDAQKHFQWLIKENPKLHPSIYEHGLNIYKELIDASPDKITKRKLTTEMEKIASLQEKYFP